MTVELNTLQQIIGLMPQDILNLIDTVGCAAQLNTPLIVSPHNKIMVACAMLSHANAMLEQCGCTVDTKIDNLTWSGTATYRTGMEEIGE